MRLKKFVERRDLWAIGIYRLKSLQEILNLDDHLPLYMIGEKGLRKNVNYQSIVSDPFLFVYLGTLYDTLYVPIRCQTLRSYQQMTR